MAHWYQTSSADTGSSFEENSNPLSAPFWLQVASLPDPQNAVEGGRFGRRKRMKRLQRSRRKSTDGKRSPQMCSPSSPLLKKRLLVSSLVAADLSSRIVLLTRNVDFAGIQEGRQRSSATRQVGRYFIISTAADRGYGGPEAWVHRAQISKPKHIITVLSASRRLVVRHSEMHCQLDLISVARASTACQTSETKN